ncbi:hypothetical protein BRARA_E00938 [Brassica rapa]|uniref:Uncharacterized protein n=1 Tax=Brassica campestris TaxID=3711 RepID=A0A397ZC18_BRACM|nr:CLAVATA3/ESR (CLE)-related protein 42-like [Brassica rapa]XP_048629224.1 CLAVATA3/ESR (CLE)-related protein 42-like [Brassica napus]XP_048636609.1 CLAVATA3/ESR (CLE)-related protein 42-like [Brassica napus]RID61824.1 hypothetical protein BRARA_E00938 [Brassica rapa]
MRSPHIINPLLLFFFLSLVLQSHQRTTDQTHRTGSTDQHVNDVAVTSPEGTRREKFRVRRPMTAWRKGKMLNDNEHGVPSGPNPISNR